MSARPLLAAFPEDTLGRIRDLLTDREPHYAAAAHLIWDTSRHLSPTEAAAALAERLCQPAQTSQPRPVPTETA